jgi:hypothetical protein
MKVFLDTNIFYNNWFAKNANFKVLFHFLNNEYNELLLSTLVVEETNNIRSRELTTQLNEMHSVISKIKKLNLNPMSFEIEKLGIEQYDLKEILNKEVDNIILIDYNDIPHTKVVGRALKKIKPFSEQEKGYRDTLIWLSFLQYIKSSGGDDDFVFITENSSDFFTNGKGPARFNNDLLRDIEELGITQKIIPYRKLFDFVTSSIDKSIHAFDHARSEPYFEEFLEGECIDYLSSFNHMMLSQYLENNIFESRVSNILDVRVEVIEDFEDGDIEGITSIDENKYYIAYSFNLRRVFIEVDIPYLDYIENKSDLDSAFPFTHGDGEVVTLEILVRPYFRVSFIYSPTENGFDSFSVDDLWLRR